MHLELGSFQRVEFKKACRGLLEALQSSSQRLVQRPPCGSELGDGNSGFRFQECGSGFGRGGVDFRWLFGIHTTSCMGTHMNYRSMEVFSWGHLGLYVKFPKARGLDPRVSGLLG